MGGERNGVERALIDSFLRFSPLNFLDFGCAPFEFFERPFIFDTGRSPKNKETS